MKKVFAIAALAALAVPALAGGMGDGYQCDNACPLAKQANVCRSFGTEALVASKVVRNDLNQVVLGNLARI